MSVGGSIDLLDELGVSRETRQRLLEFSNMLIAANEHQNLVARSTIPNIASRHIADSAQLVRLAPAVATDWLDVGTGAGLPGIVNAIMTQSRHCFVEPRRLRAGFLREVIARLDLGGRVSVAEAKVQSLRPRAFSIITARAFASLAKTLDATRQLAGSDTIWLLHKGRTATDELREAKSLFSADFELIPSITDIQASIVKITNFTGVAQR